MQIEESFNTFWGRNKRDMNLLRRLEKSNEKEILENEKLRGLLKSFIEIAGFQALNMDEIIKGYEDTHDVNLYKSKLAEDRTYKTFRKLLNSKFSKSKIVNLSIFINVINDLHYNDRIKMNTWQS